MALIHEFKNTALVKGVVESIRSSHTGPVRLMEFCGSHTAAILKSGLRQLLPKQVELISGPGCPVCVTHQYDIDRSIALAKIPGVILCTFGDMLRVPGSGGSLAEASAQGADIRIVYSTLDALQFARDNPSRLVVFLGVGFETTAPTIAASIMQARAEGISNYRVFSLAKVCPPVVRALLDSGEVRIDGIICPGHVSTIIGSEPFEFIPQEYNIACAIAGFEPVDILLAIDMLLKQIEGRRPRVEIAYRRFVSRTGNSRAKELMQEAFELLPARWRGFGEIPSSGLAIRERYRAFDASQDVLVPDIPIEAMLPERGCRCGDVLRGVVTPEQCPRFANACTPQHPLGPCMVSSEGTCSSHFLYGGGDGG